MTHAYNRAYLYDVMKNLAGLTDIAIYSEGLSEDEFSKLFAESDVARQIENGVPDMLSGKSATEMLSMILGRDVECTTISTDRSDAYWAGWILALAQWETGRRFSEILAVTSVSDLMNMYYPLHEAPEEKTIDIIKSQLPQTESKLKLMRKKRGLTQKQLSFLSDVNLRSIRAYEQGTNDISKAQGETLQQLAAALNCTIEELL
jgi:DNA-binding XRE family transcriptional regulator